MMKLLSEIMIAIITVLLPIIVKYVVDYLKELKNERVSDINNEKIRNVVNKVTDIVVNAVQATNQTYTDSLKKSGEFTKESQLTAYNETYNTVKTLITTEVAELIESEYGDFEIYINTLIERTVKEMKNV